MNKTSVRALIPVRRERDSDREGLPQETRDMLDELARLSERLEIRRGEYVMRPEIRIGRRRQDDRGKWPNMDEIDGMGAIGWLRLKATVEISSEPVQFLDDEGVTTYLSGDNGAEFHRAAIRETIEQFVYALGVAANIARPGSISFGRGAIIEDGGDGNSRTKAIDASVLLAAAGLAAAQEWPHMSPLTVEAVWEWMKAQRVFIDGNSGGRANRAVNALTYVMDPDGSDEARQMFYMMVGLEALYTTFSPRATVAAKGSHRPEPGIGSKLTTKSQLLFGVNVGLGKAVRALYNFRSEFVHGKRDFPHRFDSLEGVPDAERVFDETDSNTLLSVALLTATLQQMVMRGWSELKV